MNTRLYWTGETPLVNLIGDYHCGLLKQNRFKYEAWLFGTELNGHGFLTDNAVIGGWFDRLKETDESCERIIHRAARDFIAAAENVNRVIIRIWGIRDQAYAEVEHER